MEAQITVVMLMAVIDAIVWAWRKDYAIAVVLLAIAASILILGVWVVAPAAPTATKALLLASFVGNAALVSILCDARYKWILSAKALTKYSFAVAIAITNVYALAAVAAYEGVRKLL